MPLYALKCSHPKCGHAFEHVCSFTERDSVSCPVCRSAVETDWTQINRPPSTERGWEGKDSLSLMWQFSPKHVGELKRHMPSAEVCPRTGRLVFKSNSHQKKVYREMSAAAQRLRDAAGTVAAQKDSDEWIPPQLRN